MNRKCTKCGSDDLLASIQEAGDFITSSARYRHPSEFVHSSQYDFYWTHTVGREHLLIRCRYCQHEWRTACEDDVKAESEE